MQSEREQFAEICLPEIDERALIFKDGNANERHRRTDQRDCEFIILQRVVVLPAFFSCNENPVRSAFIAQVRSGGI